MWRTGRQAHLTYLTMPCLRWSSQIIALAHPPPALGSKLHSWRHSGGTGFLQDSPLLSSGQPCTT